MYLWQNESLALQIPQVTSHTLPCCNLLEKTYYRNTFTLVIKTSKLQYIKSIGTWLAIFFVFTRSDDQKHIRINSTKIHNNVFSWNTVRQSMMKVEVSAIRKENQWASPITVNEHKLARLPLLLVGLLNLSHQIYYVWSLAMAKVMVSYFIWDHSNCVRQLGSMMISCNYNHILVMAVN